MKDHLGGKRMAEFAALRPKTYSYLTNGNNGEKSTKTCVTKENLVN